ncbi:MAG: hypothetical protein ACYDCN_00715 [Bacteroidia bacterium]
MKRYLYILPLALALLLAFAQKGWAQNDAVSFSQADRDRIIRTEATLQQFMKTTDTQMSELRADIRNIIILFGGLVTAIIGFAIWDRRTMIRPFETKVKEIENSLELKSTRVESILSSLRELAKTDNKVAEVLKTHNLL